MGTFSQNVVYLGDRWPASGSCLQGYLNISYQELVDLLGPPNDDGDAYKTDAEWLIFLPSGSFVTIYNYKDGKNYLGEEGLDVEDITDWHIGGFDKSSAEELIGLIRNG